MTPRRGELWLVDFGEPVGREQAGRLIDRLGVVGPEPLFEIGRVLRYLLEL